MGKKVKNLNEPVLAIAFITALVLFPEAMDVILITAVSIVYVGIPLTLWILDRWRK